MLESGALKKNADRTRNVLYTPCAKINMTRFGTPKKTVMFYNFFGNKYKLGMFLSELIYTADSCD